MRKSIIKILSYLLLCFIPFGAFDNIITLIAGNHGGFVFNRHSAPYFLQTVVFVLAAIVLSLLIGRINRLNGHSIFWFRAANVILSPFLALYAYNNAPKFDVYVYSVVSWFFAIVSFVLTILLFTINHKRQSA
jgi:hypothetical protein